jgi:hypothetical protein
MSLFTSEFVKTLWKIKKALGCSHKQAFHLAKDVVADNIDADTSLIGTWTYEASRAVAGHFYGLGKAYASKRDNGRSFYFNRIAKRIYACLEAGEQYSMRDFVLSNKYDSSAVIELVDYYAAAYEARPTARQVAVTRFDHNYINVAHLPTWKF